MLSSIDIDKLLLDLQNSEEESYSKETNDKINSQFKDRIITDIYLVDSITPDLISFKFKDNSFLSYYAEGECCSESWFSDFFNINSLINTKILRVSFIDLEEYGYNTEDGRSLQHSDSVYGVKFITEKGVSVLSFRNSSNGYYGGSMERTQREPTTSFCITNCNNWISPF